MIDNFQMIFDLEEFSLKLKPTDPNSRHILQIKSTDIGHSCQRIVNPDYRLIIHKNR